VKVLKVLLKLLLPLFIRSPRFTKWGLAFAKSPEFCAECRSVVFEGRRDSFELYCVLRYRTACAVTLRGDWTPRKLLPFIIENASRLDIIWQSHVGELVVSACPPDFQRPFARA